MIQTNNRNGSLNNNAAQDGVGAQAFMQGKKWMSKRVIICAYICMSVVVDE